MTLKTIASERALLGIDQGGLAKLIGVSRATVSGWELGTSEPGGESIRRMTRVFGCSADYLLGLSADRRQPPLLQAEGAPQSKDRE
ncbi:MAG: helix-turn-helix domain-containing protein [Coriobacteriales bacterium]|nr:helix-turn-helix domain-containing protein [Coriobacteriales bacterium]